MTFPVTTGTSLILADHYNFLKNTLFDITGRNDLGYGLLRLESFGVNSQHVIRSSNKKFLPDWKNLIYFLDAVNLHQNGQHIEYLGNNLTDIILNNTGTNIVNGVKVTASLTNFLYSTSQNLLTNRFLVDSTQLDYYTPLNGQSTRTSSWGDGTLETNIDHVVEASWISLDEMKYFFNLGGYVQIDVDHLNNVSNTVSNQWKSLIESLNTLTYTRTDFLGPLVKYYPVVNDIRSDPVNGDIYLSIHVTAVRSDSEPKITFNISFNDLPDLNVNQVNGPSLVVIPKRERWFVDILGSSNLTNLTIDPILEDSGLDFDDQNFSESLVTLQFDNDGTFEIVSTGGRANFAGTWATPVRPNNGNDYWIKFTKLSNTTAGYSSISDTTEWQNINQRRSVHIKTNTLNYSGDSRAEVTYRVELSSNSSGSPVVSQGTYTLISQAFGNQFVPVSLLEGSSKTFIKTASGRVGTGITFFPTGVFIISNSVRAENLDSRVTETYLTSSWGNPISVLGSRPAIDTFILNESGINLYEKTRNNPGSRYWLQATRTNFSTANSGNYIVTTSTDWTLIDEPIVIQNVAFTTGPQTFITTATFNIKIAEDIQGNLVVSTATYTFVSESNPLG